MNVHTTHHTQTSHYKHDSPHTINRTLAPHLHHAVVHVCRAYVQPWQRRVVGDPTVVEAAEQAAEQAAKQAAKNAKRADLENTELVFEESVPQINALTRLLGYHNIALRVKLIVESKTRQRVQEHPCNHTCNSVIT
jgi:hypothetical protein